MKNTTNTYLTFALGNEKFAIAVDYVQEIVEFGHVTKVPNAPDYMLGIINLRGRILPLLDTKLKLGLPATAQTQKSRIMVLDLVLEDEKSLQIGAVVDHAREVVELQRKEIQDAPEFENLKSSAPDHRYSESSGRHHDDHGYWQSVLGRRCDGTKQVIELTTPLL